MVIRLGTSSDGVGLGCDRYPTGSSSSLGVFSCAEGTEKISCSDNVYNLNQISNALKESKLEGIEKILFEQLEKQGK